MIKKYNVEGMSCSACSAGLERAVSKIKGMNSVQVNLLGKFMICDFDECAVSDADIICAVKKAGFVAFPQNDSKRELTLSEKKLPSEKIRLIVSFPLMLIVMYISMGHMMGLPVPSFMWEIKNAGFVSCLQLLLTLPVLIVNRKFFISGFYAIIKFRPNMDSLVAVGSFAAFVYSFIQTVAIINALNVGDMESCGKYLHNLYYDSSAMILAFVTLGKMLEESSKRKTGAAVRRLMDLSPKTATCIREGKEINILAQDIVVGDIIVVHPGETVAIDGVVENGISSIDESAITGESIPIEKSKGCEVIGGTVNGTGVLYVRASKVGSETVLAKIIDLVQTAGSSKAPVAKLADKVAGIFVPIVMCIALISVAVWLCLGKTFAFALSVGISVLVISCPCALGLATPVAITVAIGRCASNGILIKSAEALEILHRTDTVILDKTGTITEGKPFVTHIETSVGIDENELLLLASSLEKSSEHPLAKAIVSYATEKGITDFLEVSGFSAVIGRGIEGEINSRKIYGGNAAYMEDLGLCVNVFKEQEGIPMFFAEQTEHSLNLMGVIYATDKIKPSSKEAIKKMLDMGIDVVMATGDSERNAHYIGNELGITAFGSIMPDKKALLVEKYKQRGKNVVMVGDGINDSPALVCANVGIAIGSGTDIAIDSADIVLTSSNLCDVLYSISFSKKTMRIIKQNLFWAFFYNVIGIMVATGCLYPVFKILLSPMIGATCMSLSSVFVNLNALRLYKK